MGRVSVLSINSSLGERNNNEISNSLQAIIFRAVRQAGIVLEAQFPYDPR